MTESDHGKAKKLVDKMTDEHRSAYETLITTLKNKILSFQDPCLMEYTNHGPGHSYREAEQLATMIPDPVLENMNSLEVFILLCSAWLHDLGMRWKTIKPEQKPDSEKERERSCQNIRDEHHKLSFVYVMHNRRFLFPSLPPPVAEEIARVCYCHRKMEDIDQIFPNIVDYVVGEEVRGRLLAAFVRLADALETDIRRVPPDIIDIQDEKSKTEWRKSQLVEGVGYDPDQKMTIIISSCMIDNDEDKSLFLEKCKELYSEFITVQNIFQQYSIKFLSMTVRINELGPPPTTKDFNASALFPDPIPSWETLKNAANKASQLIINEISKIGKYHEDLYITRENVERQFYDFICSDKTGFALVGPSGVGKTNLFCHLAKEYGKENILLLYNGASLPPLDIERLIEKDLTGYCVEQTLDAVLKNKRYFIILIDGLNDSSDPGGLLRQVNYIVRRNDNPALKIAFSCRSEIWNMLFDYERITLYRDHFFAFEGKLEASLPKFTTEELVRVFPLYKKWFNLSTNLDDVSEEVKDMLCDPLMLRLVCETYKGGT